MKNEEKIFKSIIKSLEYKKNKYYKTIVEERTANIQKCFCTLATSILCGKLNETSMESLRKTLDEYCNHLEEIITSGQRPMKYYRNKTNDEAAIEALLNDFLRESKFVSKRVKLGCREMAESHIESKINDIF